MLSVVERVKGQDQFLRTYYADVRQVGHILFQEGQTAKGAKRLLRNMREKWEQQLNRLQRQPERLAESVLAAWCGTTDTYWAGLFHCYSNPYIPGTNNSTEQRIKDIKTFERVLAKNPKPAMRFLRHATINALFVGRDEELPGEDFVASASREDVATAKALLRRTQGRWGTMRKARLQRTKLLGSLQERWKQAEHYDDSADNMASSTDPPA
jgi:hypothetical protein